MAKLMGRAEGVWLDQWEEDWHLMKRRRLETSETIWKVGEGNMVGSGRDGPGGD